MLKCPCDDEPQRVECSDRVSDRRQLASMCPGRTATAYGLEKATATGLSLHVIPGRLDSLPFAPAYSCKTFYQYILVANERQAEH